MPDSDRHGATRYPQGILKGVNTPWTEDFELDEDIFVAHTERLVNLGFSHLYVMGTAGEGHNVGDDAFRRIVDVFLDATDRPGLFPQVGVITLSVEHMIERISYAHRRGARMFQIVLPSWGPMEQSEKRIFFEAVCGRFPDAEFLHYNYPYGVNTMSPADYEMVCESVGNLVATKTSTMDMGFIRGVMQRAGVLQHFFLQGPFPYGCVYGECSLISSLAPVFPNTSMALFEAGRDGDLHQAFAIQKRLLEAAEGLYSAVKRRHIDGAFDKLTSWLVDPEFPRRLLPPSEPISDEAAAAARRYFETECADLS
ncbi:MAG: dihydrodipicolinate synthase family protein [Acidimicrobiia bacterium]